MGRFLIVDSDDFVRDAIQVAFQGQGHEVLALTPSAAVDRVAEVYRPDLGILELDGRGNVADGLALGRRFRAVSDAPLILLSTSSHLEDRIAGFEVGADDVLCKPFAVTELFARVRAVLRRSGHTGLSVLTADDIIIDERAHTVSRGETPVELTAIEFTLLRTLVRHRGQVLSKVQLLNEIWGFEHYDVNLVEVHVSALRRKLEVCGPRVIHTIRGAGYVLRAARRHVSLVAVTGA
jgi:two-component system, OmpR family, response regulator